MKKTTQILIMAFIVLTLSVTAAKQQRNVKAFTAIENNCSIDLIITQGDEYGITVIAPEKYMNKITTEVKANTLVIDLHGNVYSTEEFVIHITAVSLNEITLEGSGDAEIEGIFHAETLFIELQGSGDFEGDLNVKDLEVTLHGSGDAEISGVNNSLEVVQHGSGDFEGDNLHLGKAYFSIQGSGDAEVSGTAAMMTLTQSGSGDFDGRSFEVKAAKIRKTSSGEADVFITETVDAKLSGSGDLSIKGKPVFTNFSASGSGDIRTF